MRTAMFLTAGFLLLAAFFILGRLFAENFPNAMGWVTGGFVVLWCVATFFNMWVGVTHAGYSWGEELPIFLMLFGIPSAVAIGLKWKLF
ncbi:hypothetical protein [Pseudorhodoferax sp. Leaf267]|uniref:hypothetical protein n=1 Tax=Pseudorhodoferax sp. Leaf267 TaxID=1736316 RepID=UPI0006F2CDD2|nr:hypothetical protein [Pseudorhodoferax sp. Leaf267]KQP22803.1 hypothetical protein ASF43_02605 [Pseudorhodoferax sp. Leaf267]